MLILCFSILKHFITHIYNILLHIYSKAFLIENIKLIYVYV